MALRTDIANYPVRYKVNPDGTIETLALSGNNISFAAQRNYKAAENGFPYTNIVDAQNEVAKKQGCYQTLSRNG